MWGLPTLGPWKPRLRPHPGCSLGSHSEIHESLPYVKNPQTPTAQRGASQHHSAFAGRLPVNPCQGVARMARPLHPPMSGESTLPVHSRGSAPWGGRAGRPSTSPAASSPHPSRDSQGDRVQKRQRSPWALVSPPRGVAAGQASQQDCGGQGVPLPQTPLHPFCALARKPPEALKLSSISRGGMRLRVWHMGLQTPVHTPSFGLGEVGGRGALPVIPGSPALSLPTALGGAGKHSTPSWPCPQGSCNDLPEAEEPHRLQAGSPGVPPLHTAGPQA